MSTQCDPAAARRLQQAYRAGEITQEEVGTILNNQGGTKGTTVFPWDWGKEQPQDQPAQP